MSQILDKIKKLIEHEKSARKIGSLSEAEAFAAKVQQMLIDNQLSMSDIEREAQEKHEPITQECVRPGDTDSIYRNKSQVKLSPLAMVVASSCFCRIILAGDSIYFVGRETNRSTAVELYKLLVNLAVLSYSDELKAYRKSDSYRFSAVSRTSKDIAFKNGYFLGFTRTIQLRLMYQQKTSLGQGHGLVLVNKLKQDVDDHMKALNLRKSKQRGLNYNSSGLAAGDRRGSNVSLTSKALL